MTIAEIDPEVLIEQEIAAAEARGEDPYADKAEPEQTEQQDEQAAEASAADANEKPEAPATTEQQEEQAAPAAEAKAEELDIDALAEIAGEKPASPQPPTYQVELPADLDTKRVTLMTEKAKALEKLMSGEIDAKEYAALEVRVTGELEALSRAQARAEALAAINQQNAAQQQGVVIAEIVKQTKSVLDYATDVDAQQDFDNAVKLISAKPSNAGKSFSEIAAEANRTVLALRGLQLTGKQVAKTTEAPNREVPKPPVTLGGLPAAATAGSKSAGQLLSALSGEDFEKAYDSLPAEERAKLLR